MIKNIWAFYRKRGQYIDGFKKARHSSVYAPIKVYSHAIQSADEISGTITEIQ